MRALLEWLDGQLTVALHIDENDHADARTFLRTIEHRAARIVVDGYGTGVEVGHAMVHGGRAQPICDTQAWLATVPSRVDKRLTAIECRRGSLLS